MSLCTSGATTSRRVVEEDGRNQQLHETADCRYRLCSETEAAASALTALGAATSNSSYNNNVQRLADKASASKKQSNIESKVEHQYDEDDDFEIPQRFTKSGRKRAVSFPLKLMKVLSNKEFAHIITWLPSGKSFSILKPKAFTTDILPGYFKSAKYSSFTRKLHRWGFTRLYKGDEAGAFYHKDFQKDRLDLVEKMTCQKTTAESSVKPAPAQHAAMTQEETCNKEALPASAVSNAHIPSSEQQPAPRRASMPTLHSVVPPAVRRASVAAPLPTSASMVSPAMPQQQQQCHHDQQHQINFPPPALPKQEMPELPSQSSLVAAKINAAIELEVSRRLQERIKAAAAQMSQMTGGHAALSALLPQHPTIPPLNDSSTSLRAKLIQMQQQKERMQILAMTGMIPMPSQGLEEMPKTNIQGAKTA
mmetsp:Transcript_14932/g.28017  ORF Transcript_14932/g.28017 Transcript_14932/m.28017 type:complete len:422 (+) Transcript_14932:176-1441(+)